MSTDSTWETSGRDEPQPQVLSTSLSPVEGNEGRG